MSSRSVTQLAARTVRHCKLSPTAVRLARVQHVLAVHQSRTYLHKGNQAAFITPGNKLNRTCRHTCSAQDSVHMMDPKGDLLAGKWVLVTGSSRGIGRAIAEAMAEEGANIILTAEEAEKENLDEVKQSVKSRGAAEVLIVLADLGEPNGAKTLADESLRHAGTVDVLVNCAGVYSPMSFDQGPNKGQGPLDGDTSEWDRQAQINLQSPMKLLRYLGPNMKEKEEGYVINIASIEALYPYPSAPHYSATKWGLRGWSLGIHQALKADGIKVMVINPAQVSTPMTWSRPDAEYIPELMIQPHEVAAAAMLMFRMSSNVVPYEICVDTAQKPKKPKE